jgi:hypothetical protein
MNPILMNGLSIKLGLLKMSAQPFDEKLIEKKVTYTLLVDDKFYIIEGVPARVNEETGEELFSPETVEKLQRIIWEEKQPVRQITTPVYQFAS